MPRRAEPRRVQFPGADYPDAYVILPAEWLGAHLLRRDEAVRAAQAHPHANATLTVATVALALADEWGGIPGLSGDDPAHWDLTQTPLPLLLWLEVVVWRDFLMTFEVPKNSSAPLPAG